MDTGRRLDRRDDRRRHHRGVALGSSRLRLKQSPATPHGPLRIYSATGSESDTGSQLNSDDPKSGAWTPDGKEFDSQNI
jgi:hypothetical protein